MKTVPAKARTLLTRHQRLFAVLPNLRYFVSACATETQDPKWIQMLKDRTSGKEARRRLSRIDSSLREYFLSVLELFELVFEEKNLLRRKQILRRWNEDIAPAVRLMKESGVGPRPIPH